MRLKAFNSAECWARGRVALAMMPVLMCLWMDGQSCGAQSAVVQAAGAPVPNAPVANAPATAAAQTGSASGSAALPGAGQGEVLDRIVAVVNGEVVLESDVDEERRFEDIQPYRRTAVDNSREKTVERLVDRTLILQQSALEPEDAVSDEELDQQLTTLRKDIPDCKQSHCETDDGWKAFLGAHGFTVEEFRNRWRQRMVLLKFIEVRFRNGITISDDEIKKFYETRMLPEYAKRNVTPPKLEAISKRIEEVLLQQQVGALLVDWLKSLRAQGSVRLMTPGEVAP
jgi:peptidyl-prolyl cis-trans isomerase SurA